MKKLLFIILFVCLIGFTGYFLVINLFEKDDSQTSTFIDFNPNFPSQQFTNEPTPDITTLLKRDMSSTLNVVVNNIYKDNYYVLECNDNGNVSNVFLMTAKYDGSVARDGYEKAYQSIKDWEKNAVSEIGHIIFPSLGEQTSSVNFVWFDPYKMTNPHIVAARDFHRALFYIGETPYEMHYGWVLNYVIFAASQTCLEEVMMSLYHTH